MPRPTDRFSRTRRNLLGATGASVLLSSGIAGASCLAPRVVRVGALLPESHRYPLLPAQWLAGLRAFASGQCNATGIKLEIVPIIASDAPARLAAAKAAVESGRVDILAAMADVHFTSSIAATLEAKRVPLVVSDLGADFVRERRESEFIVRNPLGYWQANYAMGSWAAANLGKRVVIATDFLESGYDHVYAFRRGFEAAGGTTSSLEVTGLPSAPRDFTPVLEAVRSGQPDFVYAFYSGHRAESFLQAYADSGLRGSTPLAGAALLTEPVGSALSAASEGVITASPWAADLASDRNALLHADCRAAGCAAPDLFTVLGYEAGQRIAASFAGVKGGAGFARAISVAGYDSARGAVRADAQLSETVAPSYVRRVAMTPRGLANVAIESLPETKLSPSERAELRRIIKSGWTQPYLAA